MEPRQPLFRSGLRRCGRLRRFLRRRRCGRRFCRGRFCRGRFWGRRFGRRIGWRWRLRRSGSGLGGRALRRRFSGRSIRKSDEQGGRNGSGSPNSRHTPRIPRALDRCKQNCTETVSVLDVPARLRTKAQTGATSSIQCEFRTNIGGANSATNAHRLRMAGLVRCINSKIRALSGTWPSNCISEWHG